MIVFNKNGAVGRRVCIREWIEYVKLDLDENSSIEPHILDIDVDFYVLSGSGEVELNSKNIEVTKDDLVSIKAGSSRSVKSTGEKISILVIKHLDHKK